MRPGRDGVPFLFLQGHVLGRRIKLRLAPDWWWRRRCARGDCAYHNWMCPNGCPEPVFPEDE